MKKAAIFDLDGTLLNTLESIAYCGNLALSHFGLDEINVKKFPDFVGHGAEFLIKGIFVYSGASPELFGEFREYYLKVYHENGLYKTEPYDGIPELLDTLESMGIKTAVMSNKPDGIVADACKKFFDGKFDIICGQREGIPVKPDPYSVRQILNALELRPEQCVFCGDSAVDIETGINAGITALGASWGFYGSSQFEKADGILKTPSELISYL